MAKGGSGFVAPVWNARSSSLNSGAPWPTPKLSEARVLGIQRKLHKWAKVDQARRFNDLHNLVCDPATLLMAWQRVRGQPRVAFRRCRWADRPRDRGHAECRGVPGNAPRGAASGNVSAVTGQGAGDPETQRQAALPRDPRARRHEHLAPLRTASLPTETLTPPAQNQSAAATRPIQHCRPEPAFVRRRASRALGCSAGGRDRRPHRRIRAARTCTRRHCCPPHAGRRDATEPTDPDRPRRNAGGPARAIARAVIGRALTGRGGRPRRRPRGRRQAARRRRAEVWGTPSRRADQLANAVRMRSAVAASSSSAAGRARRKSRSCTPSIGTRCR
jgi:hypothetical protein